MNDWKPPVITTRRLTLRPLVAEDAQSVFDYASNPEVTPFVTWEPHKRIEESVAFIASCNTTMMERQLPGPLAITYTDTPHIVVGTIAGFWKSQLNECMEIGYAIARNYWGQGIATESVKAIVAHMFTNYSVIRIQALVDVDNIASGVVLKKAGFEFEGVLRKGQFLHGVPRDMGMYSILRP